MNEQLYLRPNIQVEPLFDHWYAWSHLMPPCTAARNITERHFPIMDSYINAPQVHAAAVKNPKMMGGPFIDYDGRRVDEIRAIRNRAKTERKHLIELSSALAVLDAMLRTNAKGLSLQPLYAMIPECLRGYVELGYDVNNNPSFRIIESLMYLSHFYDTSAQSVTFSITTGDDRPFVLSTPRLSGPGLLHLPWKFADERLDKIFKMKDQSATWREIRDLFAVTEDEATLLRTFFTEEKPKPYLAYDGPGVRWRYFGHACILVESRGKTILFDPVLSYTYESDISRYTYADLPPKIDYVLITHNHQDHILFETLLQLRCRIGTIIVPRNGAGQIQDPSLKLTLEAAGFPNVEELPELESIQFDDECSVTALPFFGEHSDLAICTKLAYLIRLGNEKLLFAADSCNVEPLLYRHLHREFGDISALFLGMECDGAPLSWLYGPVLFQRPDRAVDLSRRLNGSNYEQAIAIVNEFKCKEAYVYAMGQEPWLNHVMSLKYTPESRPIVESNRLIQECQSRGMTAERLFGEKEILLENAFSNGSGLPGKHVAKFPKVSVRPGLHRVPQFHSARSEKYRGDLAKIGNTPIAAIQMIAGNRPHKVYLKLEGENPAGSAKDRTALFLLKNLESRGLIREDSVIVESTSGNLGVSLAMVCRASGYRFLALADPKTTAESLARMESYGAQIEVVNTPDVHGGYLLSRLARVQELCAESSRYVWTNQYSNWSNPEAHFMTLGPEILEQTNPLEAVFVAASTGGTLAGISRFVRQESPTTTVVGVDAMGSAVFGHSSGKRRLTGIGSARRSDFLSPSDYDHVVVVDDESAFLFCRELFKQTGCKVGGSSGAVLAACHRYFLEHPDLESAVCVCPDRGENYASTIYNDAWIKSCGFDLHGFEKFRLDLRPVEYKTAVAN